MLLAAELPLFRALHVHGYWQMDQTKMSKSLGNVIRPLDMQARFGMDAFRYFLLREMAFGHDAEFSEAALVTRLNAELANGLGNLASRVLAMQQRYFAGAVQPLDPGEAELALRATFGEARRDFDQHVAQLAFHRGLEAVWRALDHANKYVTDTAPFRLAKDPGQQPRVGAILHELCEVLRVTAQLLAPVLPETSQRLFAQLGLPEADLADLDRPWGAQLPAGPPDPPPGSAFPPRRSARIGRARSPRSNGAAVRQSLPFGPLHFPT